MPTPTPSGQPLPELPLHPEQFSANEAYEAYKRKYGHLPSQELYDEWIRREQLSRTQRVSPGEQTVQQYRDLMGDVARRERLNQPLSPDQLQRLDNLEQRIYGGNTAGGRVDARPPSGYPVQENPMQLQRQANTPRPLPEFAEPPPRLDLAPRQLNLAPRISPAAAAQALGIAGTLASIPGFIDSAKKNGVLDALPRLVGLPPNSEALPTYQQWARDLVDADLNGRLITEPDEMLRQFQQIFPPANPGEDPQVHNPRQPLPPTPPPGSPGSPPETPGSSPPGSPGSRRSPSSPSSPAGPFAPPQSDQPFLPPAPVPPSGPGAAQPGFGDAIFDLLPPQTLCELTGNCPPGTEPPSDRPAAPPFSGGQGIVQYQIIIRFRFTESDGVTLSPIYEVSGRYWGPIAAVGTFEPPSPHVYVIAFSRANRNRRDEPVTDVWAIRTGEWASTEILSVDVTRVDGQPDTDGDPPPDPSAPPLPGINPPNSPQPQPVTPSANPGGSASPQTPQSPEQPDYQPLFPAEPSPAPVWPPFATPDLQPFTPPIAPPVPETPPDLAPPLIPYLPLPELNPPPSAQPTPDPESIGTPVSPPPPTDVDDPCSDPCQQALNEKMDLLLDLIEGLSELMGGEGGEDCCADILELLGKTYRTASRTEVEILKLTDFTSDGVFSSGCDGQDAGMPYAYSGPHFAGISAQIAALSAQLKDKLCRIDTNPAVPDWWQVRLGAGTPQLSIQFAEIANSYRPPKYILNIPHPKFTEPFEVSPISDYEKGNWMAILTLKDNSKAIVNCVDMAECERVMEEIIGIINPAMLTGLPFKIGTRGGRQLNQIKVAPKIAKYFSTGQMNLKPDWISYLT